MMNNFPVHRILSITFGLTSLAMIGDLLYPIQVLNGSIYHYLILFTLFSSILSIFKWKIGRVLLSLSLLLLLVSFSFNILLEESIEIYSIGFVLTRAFIATGVIMILFNTHTFKNAKRNQIENLNPFSFLPIYKIISLIVSSIGIIWLIVRFYYKDDIYSDFFWNGIELVLIPIGTLAWFYWKSMKIILSLLACFIIFYIFDDLLDYINSPVNLYFSYFMPIAYSILLIGCIVLFLNKNVSDFENTTLPFSDPELLDDVEL